MIPMSSHRRTAGQPSVCDAMPAVLFVDADIVVVDKPPGMPSVPARTPLDPSCVATVMRQQHGPLEAVHRLDRDTSGLLVLARCPEARTALGRAFEARLVCKRYEALVTGTPPTAVGEIHLPLAPDPWRSPRQMVDPISGRIAITRWRLVERRVAGCRTTSLLELEPVTGRSHQLRLQLAWLGTPIVGDRLYGPADVAAGRLALHAAALRFPHPADGRWIEISSPSGFRGVASAADTIPGTT